MDQETISRFLAEGCNLEGRIVQEGATIREISKHGYEREWLDLRLILTASLNHMMDIRSGIPGKTNDSISHRLILIVGYMQGISHTESLISEGQYIKAAACLKQDYEIITRIHEIKKGVDKPKITPNVKHAPKGSQRFYGELNDISHPSNINILLDLVHYTENGEIKMVSPIPHYVAEISRGLYLLHIWTMYEIFREEIQLKEELYDDIGDELDFAKQQFVTCHEMMIKSGFEIVD